MVPEVIHIFSPFRTYSLPTLRARVRMPPGFDPKSGSVNPKQPSFSPFCIAGSQVFFCSSLPKVKIGYITSADCTLTNERTPESPRSSSCVTSPYSTFDMPAQPYPFSEAPKNPRSAMGFTSSRGKRPARLHSSMIGTRLSSMKLRAVSRTRRSSSFSNASKPMKSTPRNLMAGMTSHLTKSADSERETNQSSRAAGKSAMRACLWRDGRPRRQSRAWLGRAFPRGRLNLDLRYPARHRRAIAIVFFPELLAQRRLLIKDDKQVGSQQHADHVDRDVPRVEQPGLSSYDEPDSDVHRVAHEAVQTFDDEDFGRRDRRRSPASNQSEAPERGVEIDRNTDDDDGDRRPFFSAGHWCRILP